jgi:tetratricopeptide (TPR) repeat protein
MAGLPGLLRRGLLLAPEAGLLAALLGVYMVWHAALVALLIALLCVAFTVRAAALLAGRAQVERGNAASAAGLLAVAHALYPWSPDTLALEGVAALAIGDPALAEARLRRALALLPGRPAAHAALSGALLDLGRPGEAAEQAQAALARDARCAVAHLHLAEAERARGALPEAVEDRLRAGLAAAPGLAAEAALRCALAAHLLGQGRAAEATLTLHGAEALLPRCPAPSQAALRFHLGQILTAQGQTERAQEYFRGVQAVDPHGRYAAASWRVAHL